MTSPTRLSNTIVVAGTDTEIGKTTVSCALLRALRDRGLEVRGVKPVESGTQTQATPDDEDGRRLAAAAGQRTPKQALERLKAPLAPPVAARDEGLELRPERWLDEIRDIAGAADVTLVEGAGGLLSPLADGFDTRDLATALSAPLLVVSCDSLGTLNHTLLTVEAIERSGQEVVGVVFSAPAQPDASTGRNASELQRHLTAVPVLSFPRITSVEQGAHTLDRAGFVAQIASRIQ